MRKGGVSEVRLLQPYECGCGAVNTPLTSTCISQRVYTTRKMAETDHSGTPTSQVDRAAGTQASSTDGPSILVEDLLKKCHGLLDELEQFRTFLTERKQNPKVEIRQFTNSILSELKSLEKVRETFTKPSHKTTDDILALISRSRSGADYTHPALLESTLLLRSLGRRKSQHRSSDVQ